MREKFEAELKACAAAGDLEGAFGVFDRLYSACLMNTQERILLRLIAIMVLSKKNSS